MGVDRTDYIIYGFKLNPRDPAVKKVNIWDDKFLPFIEGHQGVTDILVNDGMSGEYLVFGKLVNSQDENDEGKFTTIEYRDFFDDAEINRITHLFKELFGQEVFETLDDDEPKLFVFSHYH